MSDAAMADFMRITDSFSGEELVSAISILTEKLKTLFAKEKSPSLEDDSENIFHNGGISPCPIAISLQQQRNSTRNMPS